MTRKELDKNRETSFDNEDILVQKGHLLHEIMLLLIGFYGVIYSVINFYMGHTNELYFIVPVLPCVSIAYLLYARGHILASKIFNLIQVIYSIGGLCLVTSPETFILAFFIPIFIGTLIVFQGRERKFGYFFTAFSFAVFVFLLTTDYHIGDSHVESESDLRQEWCLNLIGSAAFSLLQITFILRISNTIQTRLLESRESLSRTNHQLKEAIDTRDKMISILSHDLRSPLLVLSSSLDLLRPSKIAHELQEKLIGELRTRVKQTISMMDNLLLWSRKQADTLQFNPTSLLLSEIKKKVQDYTEILSSVKTIDFKMEGTEEDSVVADQDLLDAILRNLLSNAFKFTPVNGTVIFSISPVESGYRFSIKDTGLGMSADQLKRVLQGKSFTRLGTALEKGHGIGMQLVRDFIERHGSRLEIVSEEAQGTTFSFELRKG